MFHLMTSSWIIVTQWHCLSSLILINIGWCNGLVPHGTKPLPQPCWLPINHTPRKAFQLNSITPTEKLFSLIRIWFQAFSCKEIFHILLAYYCNLVCASINKEVCVIMSGDRTVISWWQICCQCLHRMLLTTRWLLVRIKLLVTQVQLLVLLLLCLYLWVGYTYSLVALWCGAMIFIPPHNEVVGGVYWFHFVRPSVRLSVCPSVRPASRARSVAPTVLVVTLTLSCFDLGSDVNY